MFIILNARRQMKKGLDNTDLIGIAIIAVAFFVGLGIAIAIAYNNRVQAQEVLQTVHNTMTALPF